MLTVTTLNTTFASFEQKFKIFDNQPLFWSNFDSAAAIFIVVIIVVDEVDDVKRKEEERKKNWKGEDWNGEEK